MMDWLLGLENRVVWSATAGAFALVLIVTLAWYRWRAINSAKGRLTRAANDIMINFLLPDGDGSEIHMEYALLTPRGVIIIEVRDVEGHIFGSDAMEEWTVLSNQERFTFSNPLHGLYDRMAAVRRLLPDVPVEGYVAFTSRGEFSKGQPSQVVMLDKFVEDIGNEKENTPAESVEQFSPQWNRLREEAVEFQAGPRPGG